jgi:cap2 methyltransferase
MLQTIIEKKSLESEKDVQRMSELKTKLNIAKDKLDKYFVGSKNNAFAKYLSGIDPFSRLRYEIANTTNAKFVTNAWLKYWEIYQHFNIFNKPFMKAFFNAELPGAALCAFNHLARMKGVDIDWKASSYVGHGALDDKYGIWKSNPNRWIMNESNNGDMTVLENIEILSDKVGKVDFYSHDAGMDVTTLVDGKPVYNLQEEINLKLHLGCAIAGLEVLAVGGDFVAKQYTCFERLTREIITLVSECFELFYLCKPETSREMNSEIYLIGKGFKGITHENMLKLKAKLINYELTPIGVPISANVSEFADMIFNRQANRLEEVITGYESGKPARADPRVAKNWLAKYPVKNILPTYQLA